MGAFGERRQGSAPRSVAMPFKRYVEIGRLALVNLEADPNYGKVVVIVDVLNQNKALIDLPDMVRQPINFKRLSLTDVKIDIKRMPGKTALKAALEESGAIESFHASAWGKKLAVSAYRKNLTDYQRFQLMVAKKKKAAVVKKNSK